MGLQKMTCSGSIFILNYYNQLCESTQAGYPFHCQCVTVSRPWCNICFKSVKLLLINLRFAKGFVNVMQWEYNDIPMGSFLLKWTRGVLDPWCRLQRSVVFNPGPQVPPILFTSFINHKWLKTTGSILTVLHYVNPLKATRRLGSTLYKFDLPTSVFLIRCVVLEIVWEEVQIC